MPERNGIAFAIALLTASPFFGASVLAASVPPEINAIVPSAAATSSTASTASSTVSIAALQSLAAELESELAALVASKRSTNAQTSTGETFARVLSLGSTGADVSTLQEILKTGGFFTYPTITGYFGPATEKALAEYQAAHGLDPVGLTGPRTRALLNGIASTSQNSGTTESETPPSISSSPTNSPTTPPSPLFPVAVGFGGGGGASVAASSPTPDTTPPSVSLTAPTASSTVSGSSVTPTATASDNVAVANVQFKIDGANVSSAIMSSPYTTTWNSTDVSDGIHTLYAVAEDTSGNYATSSESVSVENPPVISSISSGTPTTTSATITWTTSTAATSSVSYGTTTAYGSASSSAALVTSHSITLTGLTPNTTYHFQVASADSQGNLATSSDQTFATPSTSAPTVSLTVPSSGATVSGSSVTLTATASDSIAVANVQFKIDGANIGSAISSSPYTTTWNSTGVSDGAHTLSAVAKNTSGLYATSSISTTVENTPVSISSISSGTPTTTSATITWTTNEAASSTVSFGLTTGYGIASSSVSFVTSHSITLIGLTAGTTYHFQVQSTNAAGTFATSSDQTFTTASLPAQSGLIYSQNWDGVTAPTLPSGWTFSSSTVTSVVESVSGINSIAAPVNQSGYSTGTYNTSDPNNGNMLVATDILFTTALGFQQSGVIARGSGISYVNNLTGLGTSYLAVIWATGSTRGLVLEKSVSGTHTTLVTVASTNFAANTWYRLYFELVGTSLTVQVRREVDGYWLNSSGSFQAAEVNAISTSDSSISGSGLTGRWAFNGTGTGTSYQDNFAVYDASTTLLAATTLTMSPTNSTLLSGYANHRGYPIQLELDGSIASPLSVSLSDGGVGGRFMQGVSSFTEIATATLATSTQLANATIFYLPPYNQTGTVTLSASSSLGTASTTFTANPYLTVSAPAVTSLSWDEVAVRRPTNLWANLPFDISGGFPSLPFGSYTAILNTGSSGATETVTSGVYSRVNAANSNEIWYKSNAALANPGYNVQLQISAWGDGSTDQAIVGVAQDSNNYVAAIADNHAGTVSLVKSVGGTVSTLASASVSLPTGSTILFQVAKQWAAVWYQRPSDATYVFVGVVKIDSSFNWQLSSTLANTSPFWGTNQSANAAVAVTDFQAGQAGGLGLQNPRVIKDITTGAPLLSPDGSSVYLTSNTGMVNDGGSNGIDSSWLVDIWECNTQTFTMTNVARLWFTRNGEVAADLPVSIGYDPGSGVFTLLASSWPDEAATTSVDVYYSTTTADVLSGVHYLPENALKLPNSVAAGSGSPLSHYDTDLLFSGGNYVVSYVETNARSAWTGFYPAAASSPTITGTFTQTWAATTTTNQEGTEISETGGNQYVLVGSGNDFIARYLATGTSLGTLSNITLDAPNTPTNFVIQAAGVAGHPALVAIPGEINGQTRYQIWTFDNTVYTPPGSSGTNMRWTWGNAVVFEALQRRTADEYTWINKN